MKANGRYEYLNLEIRGAENINNAIHENINAYADTIEDMISIEELKGLFLDFLVSTRINANLLTSAIGNLDNLNQTLFIKADKKPNEYISPYTDNEFKKSMLKTRIN